MRNGFNVTYERWTGEDMDAGETNDHGFVIQNVSLRDAIAETSNYASGANDWPIRSPRWFTFSAWNDGTREYYEQGITEDRTLHVPAHVTCASRRRIARLLGLKCAP